MERGHLENVGVDRKMILKRIYGAWKGASGVWVRIHDGERPLGKRRRSWKDDIETNLQEVELWRGVV